MVAGMTNAGRSLRHRGNARRRRRALHTFDRLPPPIRRALHEALMDWDPRWIKAELSKRTQARQPEAAIAATLRMIAAGDETELWSFAERHPAHVRANATLQRYGNPDA